MHPTPHNFSVRRILKSFPSVPQKLRLKLHRSPPRGTLNRSSCFSPALDLPYLPTELWLIIFREATVIYPDPLDISLGLSFLETSPCQVSDYYDEMQNKRNLALVNKAWNRHLQQFLYEFVWISTASQAKALALTLLTHYIDGKVTSGQYIRRLHMETPGLKRCAPDDIRTILDYAPGIVIYSDHHSVRCSRYSDLGDLRCSPEQMFSALAHPNSKLRRLSVTNYCDQPLPCLMSPMLQHTAASLEYLELSSSTLPFLNSSLDTPLDVVALPVLQSLKLTLDNVTFAVLAAWDMPNLRNVSVVSSDFSYTGPGFAQFFHSHGSKLRQLELGHSSSLVEEYYLTLPPRPASTIPLAEWCPELREFICSADAEWNWQTPDWIAPHVLLPAHPKVEFIGVRDMDKRLIGDAAAWPGGGEGEEDAPYFPLVEQVGTLLSEEAFPALRYIRDLSWESHLMRTRAKAAGPSEVSMSGLGIGALKFWAKILDRCRERRVWLEDYRGINVTMRDLRRAGLSVQRDWWGSVSV